MIVIITLGEVEGHGLGCGLCMDLYVLDVCRFYLLPLLYLLLEWTGIVESWI